MSRHRNVRGLNYDDEYDGYYDVYGHSVDDEYALSPSSVEREFTFDRSARQHNMDAFLHCDRTIAEETEEGRAPAGRQDSVGSLVPAHMGEEDRVRLLSCLDAVRNVVGETVSDHAISRAVLRHDFDCQRALDAILSDAVAGMPGSGGSRVSRRDSSESQRSDDSTERSAAIGRSGRPQPTAAAVPPPPGFIRSPAVSSPRLVCGPAYRPPLVGGCRGPPPGFPPLPSAVTPLLTRPVTPAGPPLGTPVLCSGRVGGWREPARSGQGVALRLGAPASRGDARVSGSPPAGIGRPAPRSAFSTGHLSHVLPGTQSAVAGLRVDSTAPAHADSADYCRSAVAVPSPRTTAGAARRSENTPVNNTAAGSGPPVHDKAAGGIPPMASLLSARDLSVTVPHCAAHLLGNRTTALEETAVSGGPRLARVPHPREMAVSLDAQSSRVFSLSEIADSLGPQSAGMPSVGEMTDSVHLQSDKVSSLKEMADAVDLQLIRIPSLKEIAVTQSPKVQNLKEVADSVDPRSPTVTSLREMTNGVNPQSSRIPFLRERADSVVDPQSVRIPTLREIKESVNPPSFRVTSLKEMANSVGTQSSKIPSLREIADSVDPQSARLPSLNGCMTYAVDTPQNYNTSLKGMADSVDPRSCKVASLREMENCVYAQSSRTPSLREIADSVDPQSSRMPSLRELADSVHPQSARIPSLREMANSAGSLSEGIPCLLVRGEAGPALEPHYQARFPAVKLPDARGDVSLGRCGAPLSATDWSGGERPLADGAAPTPPADATDDGVIDLSQALLLEPRRRQADPPPDCAVGRPADMSASLLPPVVLPAVWPAPAAHLRGAPSALARCMPSHRRRAAQGFRPRAVLWTVSAPPPFKFDSPSPDDAVRAKQQRVSVKV